MKKEFNLSEKKFKTSLTEEWVYPKDKVKEFIKLLKEDICNWIWDMKGDYDYIKRIEVEMQSFIDKLAGDDLK